MDMVVSNEVQIHKQMQIANKEGFHYAVVEGARDDGVIFKSHAELKAMNLDDPKISPQEKTSSPKKKPGGADITKNSGRNFRKAGSKMVAAMSFLGPIAFAAGQVNAAENIVKGKYKEAALDEFGEIPIVGDAVDVVQAGYFLGRAVDEELGLGETASTWYGNKAGDLYDQYYEWRNGSD